MKCDYKDITDRLGEPLWWDENAVPRYTEFAPREGAYVYAQSICLIEIACQACDHRFQVALSDNGGGAEENTLENMICERKTLSYGDPPSLPCCSVGPTMSAVPRRVLQFWNVDLELTRRSDLEIDLVCEWMEPRWDRDLAKQLIQETEESND